MKPIRIQRKRSKGWRMPPNTVYVGRPTKFGNPSIVDMVSKTPVDAVVDFVHRLATNSLLIKQVKEELKGKNLACWCPLNQPCHADILLKVANS